MTRRSIIIARTFLIYCGKDLYDCCRGITGFRSAVKGLFSGLATMATYCLLNALFQIGLM